MAERATIARPYAKAAFAHARDKNTLDAWSGWLGTARAVVLFGDRIPAEALRPFERACLGGAVPAVTVIVLAGFKFDGAAFTGIFQPEVDDACNGIRAVLGSCTISQYFNLF